jgi:hypothetical protein
MTPEDHAAIFKLLDRYAWSQYQCFLTELFPTVEDESRYHLCFRPMGICKDSTHRYACRYLTVELAELKACRREKKLTDSIVRFMDSELLSLMQEIRKGPSEHGP